MATEETWEVIDEDPWDRSSPWDNSTGDFTTGDHSHDRQRSEYRSGGGRSSYSIFPMVSETRDMNDHTPHRFIHDVPPSWDGQQPEAQLEPYVKLLEGWLATTEARSHRAA